MPSLWLNSPAHQGLIIYNFYTLDRGMQNKLSNTNKKWNATINTFGCSVDPNIYFNQNYLQAVGQFCKLVIMCKNLCRIGQRVWKKKQKFMETKTLKACLFSFSSLSLFVCWHKTWRQTKTFNLSVCLCVHMF